MFPGCKRETIPAEDVAALEEETNPEKLEEQPKEAETETTALEEESQVESEESEEIDKLSFVLQKVSPSVVNIEFEVESEDGPVGKFISSGTIFTNDGYIITASPNVEKLKKITVTLQDGTQLSGDLIGEDRNTDIAVIKIDAQNLESPTFTSAEDIKVGEIVLSMSRPFGKELNFSQGFVLETGIDISISPDTLPLVDLIKTDTEGKPGTAGGPLVTIEGSIIGVNLIMIPSFEGEKSSLLALPSDIATNISDQIIKYGRARIPFIGIEMGENTTDIVGVYVESVMNEYPAEKAGIKQGDVIVEFNKIEVKNPYKFLSQILRHNVGDIVQLKVYRNGDYITLNVELSELEQSQ